MASDEMREREDWRISSLCKRIAFFGSGEARVISRPDRERVQGGCDAVLEWEGARYALEHTTLDSYFGQRAEGAVFSRLARLLQPRLERRFPAEALIVGIEAAGSRRLLRALKQPESFLASVLYGVAEVLSARSRGDFVEPNFGIEISVARRPSVATPGRSYVLRDRLPPSDEEARRQVEAALIAKAELRARNPDATGGTILVLDSPDISYGDPMLLRSAFLSAEQHGLATAFDWVFYAAYNEDMFYVLKAPRGPVNNGALFGEFEIWQMEQVAGPLAEHPDMS